MLHACEDARWYTNNAIPLVRHKNVSITGFYLRGGGGGGEGVAGGRGEGGRRRRGTPTLLFVVRSVNGRINHLQPFISLTTGPSPLPVTEGSSGWE